MTLHVLEAHRRLRRCCDALRSEAVIVSVAETAPCATPIPPASRRQVLVARGITKSFPGVLALDNVDFDVRAGEVTALLGENGAGKSTLIKMMAGFYSPDRGEISVDGKPAPRRPCRSAPHRRRHHPSGRASGAGHVGRREHHARPLADALRAACRSTASASARSQRSARVAPHLNPSTPAGRLSPADQQLVEIARAISEDSKVLVMDEPTTSLSPPEIDRLFGVVNDLKAKGLGIVFVSHWLEEVFRVADRVTVLRDGRLVGTRPIAELDQDKVIRMMVGREVRETVADTRPIGDVVLSVRNLNRDERAERHLLRGPRRRDRRHVGAGRRRPQRACGLHLRHRPL